MNKFVSPNTSRGQKRPEKIFDCPFNPLKITGVTVTWEVENIWNLSFDGVSSDSFLLADHIFHLFVRRYELSVAVYLSRDGAIAADFPLLCGLKMVDAVGRERPIGAEKEVIVEGTKEFVLIESINIRDLEREKEEYLSDDTLVLKCVLSSSYRRNLLNSPEHHTEEIIPCLETLSSDFENLYTSEQNPDAVLKAEDDTEFPVHKTVLRARSPALATMLSQASPENAARVDGIQTSVFRDLLYYIYSGKIRGLNASTAVPMFTAAGRFSLHELKGRCLRFLRSNLSHDNILDIAALAHESGDLSLREETEQYIVENLTTILQSEKWRDFCADKYRTANEILTSVLLRMKPAEAIGKQKNIK